MIKRGTSHDALLAQYINTLKKQNKKNERIKARQDRKFVTKLLKQINKELVRSGHYKKEFSSSCSAKCLEQISKLYSEKGFNTSFIERYCDNHFPFYLTINFKER